MKISIESLEFFEWYDGIVLGLARGNDVRVLVCLLAFDPDDGKKLYVLFKLSKKQDEMISSLVKEHGPAAMNKFLFSKLLTDVKALYLADTEPKKNRNLEMISITKKQRRSLPPFFFPLVERAVSRGSISKWLK